MLLLRFSILNKRRNGDLDGKRAVGKRDEKGIEMGSGRGNNIDDSAALTSD